MAPAPAPAPAPDPAEPVRGGSGKGGDPIRVYADGTIRLSNGIFTHGCAIKAGYRRVKINGKHHGVHQLVKVAHDRRLGVNDFVDPDKISFDHVNRNRADNRYANIAAASLGEQVANRTITRSNAPKRSKPIRGRLAEGARETAWVTYASVKDAARALNLDSGSISAVADPAKATKKTTGGYVFEFVPVPDLPGERWVPIRRYDRKTDTFEAMKEEVSSFGRYKNSFGAISDPEPNANGVYMVTIQGNIRTVPALMLDSFCIPIPEGVARKDVFASYRMPHVSTANTLENLVFKTNAQIKKDANTNPTRKCSGPAHSIGIRGRPVGTETWVEYTSMQEPMATIGVSQGSITHCLSSKYSRTTAVGTDGVRYEFERIAHPLEPAADVAWVELLHADLIKIAEILARAEAKKAENAEAKAEKTKRKRAEGVGGGGGGSQPTLARFWDKNGL